MLIKNNIRKYSTLENNKENNRGKGKVSNARIALSGIGILLEISNKVRNSSVLA